MVNFAIVTLLAPLLAGIVGAAPIPEATDLSRRAAFVQQQYAQFQISDGTAGNAAAKANAVFVDPFKGQDLSTISAATISALNTMREAAETAETAQFDPQIAKASGAAATALTNGKIQNKVLKLTGEVQVINIKIAQAKAKGSSTSSLESSLTAETTKLNNNIALDKKAAGQASKGVA
ncbi:hypothetical protein BD410DRAFT_742714 [Rickenella mellea]|uniref:Small secreted protein n=1 Tax=Rickenella mellea TaxID=50990 RepID=A0A4Y7QET8_9AGAM|nr:hypothetical protein BD410DRAFT_742714 [Rickenella mellea]